MKEIVKNGMVDWEEFRLDDVSRVDIDDIDGLEEKIQDELDKIKNEDKIV